MRFHGRIVFCVLVLSLASTALVLAPKSGASIRAAKNLQQSPANLPGGPGVGGVNSLAVDPSDSNLLYADTFYGGVFRSMDGGRSWNAANSGLDFGSLGYRPTLGPITVDPTNHSTLYTILPDLYESTDRGSTWAEVTAAAANGQNYAYSYAVDSAGTIYVDIAGQGLISSTDHGATFSAPRTAQIGEYINIIAVDMSAPGTLYADNNDGLFKTIDGGTSWSPLNLPFTYGLAIDPKNNQILYATDTSSTESKVRKSTDGGSTWSSVDLNMSTRLYSFAIDPVDTNVIYLGGYQVLLKSSDAGATWTSQDLGRTQIAIRPVADPSNPGVVYLAGSGVLKTSDSGAGWSPMNAGLPAASVVSIAFVNDGTGKMLAGADDGGIYASTDGVNWSLKAVPGAYNESFNTIIVDPSDPSVVYAATNYDIFLSTDGGDTWSPDISLFAIFSLAIAPSNPSVLYAATGLGVFRRKNGKWKKTQPIPFGKPKYRVAISLAIDPTDANTVYVGVSGAKRGHGQISVSSLFKSTNGGKSWVNIASGPVNQQYVTAMGIAPDDPRRLYAGSIVASLFISETAGKKWSTAGNGLRAEDLFALDVEPSGVIYAGTDTGAFKSTDGAENFTAIPVNLFNPRVNAIAVDKAHSGVVYLGTELGVIRLVQ